jgi:hypothetical protein
MTPDDLQRALAYRITELRILSDAIGAAQRDALANSIALDDPSVLYLQVVRGHVDTAVTTLVQAQVHTADPGLAARLADDFEELEGTSSSIACPEIDIASGTQETQE